jgi:uncharacterized membrane protein YebE (DUF533 family)
MFRRRRPLLRAAAVGGVAYHAGKNAQRNQEEDQAALEAEQQSAPAEPAGISSEGIEQLKQLAALKDQGVLTEQEFEAEKQKILGS